MIYHIAAEQLLDKRHDSHNTNLQNTAFRIDQAALPFRMNPIGKAAFILPEKAQAWASAAAPFLKFFFLV
mgnify:CR=1 FL=1